MQNIIKSLFYQIKRDNFTYIVAVIVLAMVVLIDCVNLSTSHLEDIYGSSIAVRSGETSFIAISVIAVLFTARICGWDFNDKTINYELLSGHSKRTVFFSRVIVSMLFVMLASVAILVLPVLFFTVINGWGHHLTISGALSRLALTFFPIFRMVSEMILLTFILRNCYGAMVLGWLGYEFSLIISMMPKDLFGSDLDLTLLFSSSTIMETISFSNYYIGYVNGEDVQIFETALSEIQLYGTVFTGLGAGVLCLAVAYLIFKKRDMV